MRVFEANITYGVIDFFEDRDKDSTLELTNSKIERICGIKCFFSSKIEIAVLFQAILSSTDKVSESDRAEYGDFQTNSELSDAVCKLLGEEAVSPEVVIEPTCGKGNFILSCLKTFQNIKSIYGIEIYKPYVWETKFAILDYFLNHPKHSVPEIEIIHQSIFDFDFSVISSKHQNQKLLVIGNPPWVTNSKLSGIGSQNLPAKSNFKKHSGIEAITGKGNFDIGESVSLKVLAAFSHFKGNFAFLIKNSVAKNILFEQLKTKYQITNIKQYDINAKKEFNVSVNASLFCCSFGNASQFIINEYDFYSGIFLKTYGWVNNRFVSNVKNYQKIHNIDGKFPYEWRQGLKHDASKIMEFEPINGQLVNKLKIGYIIKIR